IVAAVTLARLSPNVVTDEQAEEILGMPVHGTVPSLPKLHTERHTLLDPLPAEAERFIDSLCVRAEATAVRGSSTLTVVVTGAQRTAGATTVAAAMARRFADNGSRVVLIDGDRQDPELARLFVDGR